MEVKPALKKKKKAAKQKGSLQWDEDAIAEHDQLRGTRMKIEEPNTPYHYDLEHDNNETTDTDETTNNPQPPTAPIALDLGALQERLTRVHEKEVKTENFQQRRRQHYNEMEMVKQFRKQQQQEDSDKEVRSINQDDKELTSC